MDIITYALCKKMIADIGKDLGKVFTIKGKVQNYNDLPSDNNKNGDVYLVGPKDDGSYAEYY